MNQNFSTSTSLTFQSLLIVSLFMCLTAKSQDRIYTTSDTTFIEVKVTEVNPTNLKYRKYSNMDGPIYTIGKEDIIKVIYENGDLEEYEDSAPVTIERQESPELMPGSRLYLSFVKTPNARDVDGDDAVAMLRTYIEGKTNCVVVNSPEEADFELELQVVKRMMADRGAKITIRHLLDNGIVHETKWARGTSNAFYGYSGSRHAISIALRKYVLKKYQSIASGS